MTTDIWILIGVLGAAIVLLATDRLRMDIVSLLALLSLVIVGIIPAEDAFTGFANPAVITVIAVFVMSQGVVESGIATTLGNWMVRVSRNSARLFLGVLMITVALMSAVMNNIGAVAIMMPAVISGAHALKESPSKFLMPLAFASLIGGNLTLIGTPSNLLGSSLLAAQGYTPLGLLDFAPTGLFAVLGGLTYMAFWGYRLVPIRVPQGAVDEEFALENFVGEFRVMSGASILNTPLDDLHLTERHGLTVIQNQRFPSGAVKGRDTLQADDVVLLQGAKADLLAARKLGFVPTDLYQSTGKLFAQGDYALMQLVVAQRASITGKTLQALRFRNTFGVSVIAIRHANLVRATSMATAPLASGDTLLVDGPKTNLARFRNNRDFIVLETPTLPSKTRRRRTAFILGSALLLIVLGVFPAAIGMTIGAVAMLLTHCVTPTRVYDSIDWRIVVLIGAFLPIGAAIEQTGTAALLAEQLLRFVGAETPLLALALVFSLTAALTMVISNTAATVLLVPLAIDLAVGIGASPYPFVMGVIMAASMSFLTPIAHQVNILVMGAGGYKFTDYAKVGIWLNVIILLIALLTIPLFWPFYS